MTPENKVVVGIDIGSETHQYQISQKEKILSRGKLKNNRKDAKKLIKKIESVANKEETIIGIEATGTYHLCLQKYLVSNGYKVIVINPLKTNAYKQIDDYGNKSDPIDANGICQFLIDEKHKKIKQMKQKYLTLRELCRCRQKLLEDMVRINLRIYSRLTIINPEFSQYFSNSLCTSGIFLLENYLKPKELARADVKKLQKKLDKIGNGMLEEKKAEKVINLAKESFGVEDNVGGYVRYLQYQLEQYKFVKKKVSEITKEIRKEAKKGYCAKEIEIINSIRGISIEMAAGILSELGDINNFQKMSSIVRFAGMIALKNQSGKKKGKSKMSKQGSKYLRKYLHQGMMATKIHSPTFAAIYANRKLKIKDLDSESKKVAKAKARSNLARRLLETIAKCLMSNRKFSEKIAFNSIQIDEFIRETFKIQFQKQLME